MVFLLRGCLLKKLYVTGLIIWSLIVIYPSLGLFLRPQTEFIEECIVRDLAWLLSIILMLNVLVQTVIEYNVQLVHS